MKTVCPDDPRYSIFRIDSKIKNNENNEEDGSGEDEAKDDQNENSKSYLKPQEEL